MTNSPRFFQLIGIHVLCWFAFIVYETTINYFLSVPIHLSTIYFYVCNITLFYTHAYILDLTFNRPEPSWTLALSFFALELLAVLLLKLAGDYLTLPPHLNFPHNKRVLKAYLVTDLGRSAFYTALATLYWYRGFNATLRQEKAAALMRELGTAKDNAELKASLADSRNAFLQQQLNPHLIFNTLNFIYNAVYRVSEDGGKAVLLLADILNFSLRDTDESGKILLADELEQLDNLVRINRYRFHFPLQIELSLDGTPGDQRILPLILLTLTENMFKHGDFRLQPAFITMNITEGGYLRFSTKNTKKHLTADRNEKGIGIRNIRMRLEHAYKDNFILETEETDTHYHTTLEIQL
ncbi:sensor histidine kinase [Mucilaginibacter sp. FT3.2]|uniref:sensor histidine kinase n=1 Tax=Mucilaginibacter sp. FT3.2 TaxID=2723090 RepID=UPI00161FF656|nr:sensor histidine kinase [Mucilaginibacter sp. FT3.2]MBB6234196.1 LytS/YehU family sensor histidine kinase [Mucilaginibacter sp. FT3.2]